MLITVAHRDLLDGMRALPLPPGVQVELWDLAGPPDDPERIDVVVVPHYFTGADRYAVLADLPRLRLVQLPSAGYEHALPHLPAQVTVCNGRGVHDAGTAELAVGLILAVQRGIDAAVRAMPTGRWDPVGRPSLADRRVMILGYGSVGAAVARRLVPFEVELVRVAATARDTADGHVHAVAELADLLPTVDVVVVTLPLTERTAGLLGAAELGALPDGALVVNVGRGKVVETDALLAELRAGRLRAALDVTDPEPLPADHPLWGAPGALITPHVGGYCDAVTPRLVDLLRRQVAALAAGDQPVNVVREGCR